MVGIAIHQSIALFKWFRRKIFNFTYLRDTSPFAKNYHSSVCLYSTMILSWQYHIPTVKIKVQIELPILQIGAFYLPLRPIGLRLVIHNLQTNGCMQPNRRGVFE